MLPEGSNIAAMVKPRAVIFDWRGTLVTTLSATDWVRNALILLGRDADGAVIAEIVARLTKAAGDPDRLDAPGIDADVAVHRATYYHVFADAGIDKSLADALYTVESDPAYNELATDVVPTLQTLANGGCRVGVVSDIHFDLRPVFDDAGLGGLVDSFTLSFEHGLQKPDPGIFRQALDDLGTKPDETLMIGDRPSHDGAAVDVGMATLLLPPLTSVSQGRLHQLAALITSP